MQKINYLSIHNNYKMANTNNNGNTNTNIPKIIHQIWFQGFDAIPPNLLDYHNSWKENNPTYTFKLWDEKSINELMNNTKLKWINETYNSFDLMIQKIDFAKYVILYEYGGIYLDLDIKCLKPIDNLLSLPEMKTKKVILSKLTYDLLQRGIFFISGHANFAKLVNNGVIMAVAKHPLLLKTIEYVYNYKNNYFKHINNFLYIFNSTGPLVLTNSLVDFLLETNLDNDIGILDQSVFEACDIHSVKNDCKIPNNAIGLHVYASSWTSDNEKKLINLYYFLKNNIFIILILILILFLR